MAREAIRPRSAPASDRASPRAASPHVSLDATIQMFFEEAADVLREYEAELLRLEVDPEARGALDAVFRSAHTLKGTSATLGFESIARFTHALEDVLGRLRKRELDRKSVV